MLFRVRITRIRSNGSEELRLGRASIGRTDGLAITGRRGQQSSDKTCSRRSAASLPRD